MHAASHTHRLTASDLWRLARVGSPVPIADGARLVVPVTTYDLDANKGIERLYLVPSHGGSPRPLTSIDSGASQPSPSPDGSQLAFVRKPQGEDHGQIHLLPLDGGEPRRLTDFPFGAFDPRWLPDGKQLVCVVPLLRDAPTLDGTRTLAQQRVDDPVKAHVTEDRVFRFWDTWLSDGKVPHLFLIDTETGARRDLIPDSERWFDFMEPTGQYDIAPDGREIAFSANSSTPPHKRLRWAIFTAPIGDGPTRCMTPQNPADDLAPRYSPDGRYLLYGMQREWDFYADRVRLVLLDRTSGKSTVLTEDWDRSAACWEFTPDGETIVFQAEDRGHTHLYRLAIDSGTPQPVAEGGTLAHPRAARDGHVYFQRQDLNGPPEIARCPLAGGEIQVLTHFNDALLGAVDLGEVENLEFIAAAGDPVQMFVVYPPDFDPGKRWPLVHLIHGGPHGISGDQFHMRWNAHAFAAPGYVVAMVNFHGSTSFGQAFATSICGSWGDHPMTDIMAATDTLLERGFIDPDRIAVTGGSYGGYLTAWLTSQTDRFACAVCHAGVIDLPSMYASDVTQGRRRSFGGVPWDGREAIERWSPAAFADGFKTPTLVIHGERDFRVPVTQGIELYGVLKAMGVDARLVDYPDENHWILKPRNSMHWYGEVLGWLRRYLGGQELTPPPDGSRAEDRNVST
jgi:dipeptidyl aminopeptidase/acylaminoacyl peptidase